MENNEAIEKPKDKTMIAKLVSRKKSAILVEYKNSVEDIVRVSIPADKAEVSTDDKYVNVSESVVKAGIPYGIPWESKIPDITIKGSDVEKEFHKAGIWTLEDIKQNPNSIQGIVMAVSADITRAILNVLKEYSSKEI